MKRTDNGKDQALQALREWRQNVALRDELVLAAIAAGATDVEINEASRVSRTTIGQIRDPQGALAIRERARRALEGWPPGQVRIYTHRGQVRIELPWEDAPDLDGQDLVQWERSQETVVRLNAAYAVIRALKGAGLSVAASNEPEGRDLGEHLAHRNEQHLILSL